MKYSIPLFSVFISLNLFATACSKDSDDKKETENTEDTAGDGDGDGAACEACFANQCEDEFAACASDTVCECWENCSTDGFACQETCGDLNETVGNLNACTLELEMMTCAEVCGDACQACAATVCETEFQDCLGDATCLCSVNYCDGDNGDSCTELCGASSDKVTALEGCFQDKVVMECMDECT